MTQQRPQGALGSCSHQCGHGRWHRSTGPGTWHKQHRKSNWADRGVINWDERRDTSIASVMDRTEAGGDGGFGLPMPRHWWQAARVTRLDGTHDMRLELRLGDAGASQRMFGAAEGTFRVLDSHSLRATGSWFLKEPCHGSITDSPRWWLQDCPEIPRSTEGRQSVLSHRRSDGSAWDLPPSHPCLATSRLWAAPRCFGWDGICS